MLAPPTPPDWGSSPLARGLPRERAHRRDPHRIIPARAGFTAGYAGCRWDAADHPRSRGVYRRPRRGPQRDRGIIPARAGFTGGRRPQEGDEGDHPRSRGVYAAYAADSGPDYGSSPLARGLPGSQGRQGGMNRIIPARAGFTRPALLNCLPWRDHPRSRGVYGWTVLSSAATPGSSPLARGLRPGPSGRRPGPRIIPARAGFTPVHLVNPLQREDHPRSRGVYTWRNWMRNAAKGSSPLARGLPQTASSASVSLRIIPARAGFTRSGSPRGAPAGDHPRSRGVYAVALRVCMSGHGSSPLARGLLGGRPAPAQEARIIPARAGFTRRRRGSRPRPPDHPRSRGVYCCALTVLCGDGGSSPLARGLPGGFVGWRLSNGIIPARAGFTISPGGENDDPRDHPRSRGVYVPPLPRISGMSGSSPLARGLRSVLLPRIAPGRIIPARAGFTGSARKCAKSCQDHPRSRGVYSIFAMVARQAARIIPARAGFTAVTQGVSGYVKDHPRSRGVYTLGDREPPTHVGSSPLARGLRGIRAGRVRRCGIIPARAGFTDPA